MDDIHRLHATMTRLMEVEHTVTSCSSQRSMIRTNTKLQRTVLSLVRASNDMIMSKCPFSFDLYRARV